jgi:uncharacterized protein YbaA (DUF1428 family)
MAYIDGFLRTMPTARFDEYRALAGTAGAPWTEYGAIVELLGRQEG